MRSWARHWQRLAITLIPLVLALLHALGVLHTGIVPKLDDLIYDVRLTATMPRTLDERIVIVDIDEKSLAEVGRWPWSRNKMAKLFDNLFGQYQVALVGTEVVFAEPDESSGLKQLRALAADQFKDQPAFTERLAALTPELDYDSLFANALKGRPVVLGYYFTGDRGGRKSGVLPAPVMDGAALQGQRINTSRWDGYGANIDVLADAAPKAGFFNVLPNPNDGMVRSLPLLAEHESHYYESLALAMFRKMAGDPQVRPGFASGPLLPRSSVGGGVGNETSSDVGLDSVQLVGNGRLTVVPVTDGAAALIPFRGPGGPRGGSYTYVSAADVLAGTVPPAQLLGKIVLLGTTAPGLLDLRVTPVGEAYPGVETHANVLSGMLDRKILIKPDYALGYEVLILVISGLLLAFGLPKLSAPKAVLLSAVVMLTVVGLNLLLYGVAGLVLPLASALLTAFAVFALNMSYGYFVESRSKRELARLFGTYVPPELVDEMVRDPERYSMAATSQELTVLFCDMRGFTKMSEQMEPLALQQLLNDVFSRLTQVIRANRGTIDKYMGDCVMAFWGAPVGLPNHAELAVKAALRMTEVIQSVNESHRERGLPEIGIGIGINTGLMCVGDMGSAERQAYTVIGDAVNLGSRLEGLSKVYGVQIVASASTRRQTMAYAWQELDKVRVKGKQEAVSIFEPRGLTAEVSAEVSAELSSWARFMAAYQAQDWAQCDELLLNIQRLHVGKTLYHLYQERLRTLRHQTLNPEWDGAINFETK